MGGLWDLLGFSANSLGVRTMILVDSACTGPFSGVFRRPIFIFLLVISLLIATGNQGNAVSGKVMIVGNDRGGSVIERANLIQALRKKGTRIEIRGQYCMSACTMFLGLKTTCVLPGTKFGFHGPSSRIYGIALNATSFERWSTIMAQHYPEPLRGWFLSQGRHLTVGFHEYSGRDLIKMGISQCTA